MEFYASLWGIVINAIGHFLDSVVAIYFLHRFFPLKKQKYEHMWLFAIVLMTVLLQTGDTLSGNNRGLWMAILFGVPFLYVLLFDVGEIYIKFLICAIWYVVLMALESIGVQVICLMSELTELNYAMFVAAYIFRRVFLKLVLLFVMRFLLNYSIYDSYYDLPGLWDTLGVVSAFELILLMFQKDDGTVKTTVPYLIIDIFCCFVPILFYYVVYLMEVNLKRYHMGISQKNYIDIQEQYMSQLVTMQDSLRKFQHDYKAHLFCIDNLLLEENYEELHLYLKKIHDMGENYGRLQAYTADARINMILNQLNDLADKSGLHFSVNGKDAKMGTIALYDLNMILFNLYSNAAEAAVKTQDKRIDLQLRKNHAYFQIVIQNSVARNPLEHNPNFFTDKKDKDAHGYGMQIIRNVVEKYQGMIQYDGNDTMFKVNILLLDEAP